MAKCEFVEKGGCLEIKLAIHTEFLINLGNLI